MFRRKSLEDFYEFLQYRLGYRPITIQNYRTVLRKVLRDLGVTRPSVGQAEDYIALLVKKEYSASHINNTSAILENYLKFLGKEAKLPKVRRPKPKIKDTLTEGEVARILAACKNSREKAIIAILAYTGIRNREFCNLKVKDVDLEKGIVRIIDGKGGKSGVSYLPREAAQIVSKYLSEYPREGDEYLITTLVRGNQYSGWDLRKRVKVIAKRAGIEKRVYPHLFRHSLATNLIKNGASIITVQNQLRHESLNTTMVYIRAFPQRVQDEVQYFVPRYL